MISARALIVLFAMVAISQADDKTSADKSEIDEKFFMNGVSFSNSWSRSFSQSRTFTGVNLVGIPWLNNPFGGFGDMNTIFGACVMPNIFSNAFFLKDTDTKSVSRRAFRLDADQLTRRASDDKVTCLNENNEKHSFSIDDCTKAAAKTATDHTSKAQCGKCVITLMTKTERVALKQKSATAIQMAVDKIMKSCASGSHSKRDEKSHHTSDNDVAVVLSKADSHVAC